MISIPIDDSLVFHFAPPWQAIRWEKSPEQLARQRDGRKTVDMAATADIALLIEVKDERIRETDAKVQRSRAVRTGEFMVEIATKFRHSVEDILAVASTDGCRPIFVSFQKRWSVERRRLLLWWELPPEPPSGSGTEIQRWKHHLSAQGRLLEKELRDLTPRILIANQRIGAGVIHAMKVEDRTAGVGERRTSVRARIADGGSAPRKRGKK